MVAVPIVIMTISGSKSHSAIHFSGLCRANDFDVAEIVVFVMIAVAGGKEVALRTIGDLEQLVRIGALVSTGADG